MPVSENPKHLLCMVCSENIFRAASSIDTRLACPGMAYNGCKRQSAVLRVKRKMNA